MNFKENPFASRKAVQTEPNFRGRNEVLETIIRRLSDNINLFGEPRIGRTSLLSFLVNKKGACLLPEFGETLKQYCFIFLDLQMVRNETDFWRALVDELTENLDSAKSTTEPQFPQPKSSFNTYELVKTFESLIKSSRKPVVVVFDNFDLIMEFEKEEALQMTDKLRAISQNLNRQISYLVGSVDSINVLFEEHNLIQRMSPFPSIFEYHMPLGLLEMSAIKEIVRSPESGKTDAVDSSSTGENVHWLETNEDLIIKLAGRHPDLVKRVCFHFDEAFSCAVTDVEKIKENIKSDAHVKFLFDFLVRHCRQKEKKTNKPYLEILEQVAQGEKADARNILMEFSMLGLIEIEHDGAKIFSELFREYLTKNARSKNQPEQTRGVSSAFREVAENSLTPRELRLYNCLNENTGEPCSRQDLKKAIWGTALPSGDADLALEQLVKRLRLKIEKDDKNPQKLLTIRGKGYLLKE